MEISLLFLKNILKLNYLCYLLFCVSLNVYPQQWEWTREYSSSSNLIAIARDIVVDDSANFYFVGSFYDSILLDTINLISKGGSDILIAKCDHNGKVLWAKNAGSIQDDAGMGIVIDDSGYCYITGFFNNTAYYDSIFITAEYYADIFIAKLSQSGDFIWAVKATGNSADDWALDIAIDRQRNLYITGFYYGTAVFGNHLINSYGNTDVFIAKCDNNGFFQWAKGGGGNQSDCGYAICTNNLNDVFICGSFQSTAKFGPYTYSVYGSTNSSDIFLLKINNSGNFEWCKRYGSIEADEAYGIDCDSINVYITGYFRNNAVFDTAHIISKGVQDIFIASIKSQGEVNWSRGYGGSSYEYARKVKLNNNNIFLIGNFRANFIFDSIQVVNRGDQDFFVSGHNLEGKVKWVNSFGTPLYDFVHSLDVNNNNIYLAGFSNAYGTFHDWGNLFLGKIKDVTVSVGSSDSLDYYPDHFTLSQNYPNPFNPNTKIRYTIPLQGGDERGGSVTLKVYDVLGNEVATLVDEYKPAGNYEIEFNAVETLHATSLPSGVYFYRLKAGEFVETKKMILLR